MVKNRVIVAMSGGVDSSVAAALLVKQGYEVIGVTMRLSGTYDSNRPAGSRGCCSIEDVDDARRVCQLLGIRHYLLNFEQEFQTHVIDYFCQEYQRGRTPHPCLACNDKIKFDFLMRRASFLEADYIATGHYARIDKKDAQYQLLKAVSPLKDQSYVLYTLKQSEMERLLLPVGWYPKEEIRNIASDMNLPVANKPDSQEICFIPDGSYQEFLKQRLQPKPGQIADRSGNVLGDHSGIEFFTVGQRRGLGLTSAEPLYVLNINADNGRGTGGQRWTPGPARRPDASEPSRHCDTGSASGHCRVVDRHGGSSEFRCRLHIIVSASISRSCSGAGCAVVAIPAGGCCR